MAEKEKKTKKSAQKQKKSWFKGLKSEFSKIVWTDQKTLGKQSVAVVVISAITCVLISLIDAVGLQIIELLVK